MTDWNKVLEWLEPKPPPFCPEEPSLTQKVFLRTMSMEAMFGGMAGGGKALSVTLPLLTVAGWVTMGTVRPGDVVYAPDGSTTTVVAASGIMTDRPCYEVRFDDGSLITCDAEHLWLVVADPDDDTVLLSAEALSLEVDRTFSVRSHIRSWRITSVTPCPSVPVQCIQVDRPDGMFLAGEALIPTHNSSALLMSALQHVDTPGYSAMLFRRTYADLALPGALMDRFTTWMANYPEVRWNGSTYTATFPSGARIGFGYLNNVQDFLRYKGSELQMIGFDEVTEIREEDYRYMFSRLRRPASGPLSKVPLRMRSATNPAPNWVRQRFIVEGKEKGRIFVPSSLTDNPGVDADSYRAALAQLDPVERARLEMGDWWATSLGTMFAREDFVIIGSDEVPPITSTARAVRFWDCAATAKTDTNDPDWTVGTLMVFDQGIAYVLDVRRFRKDSAGVEAEIAQTAKEDGPLVAVRMEREPGSSGKMIADQYARYVLPGFDFEAIPATGDKVLRAQPFKSAVKQGNVRVVRGAFLTEWLDEFSSFPESCPHDDQVDSAVGAHTHLTGLGLPQRRRASIIV